MKIKFLIVLTLALSVNLLAQSPGKILSQANKALGGEKVLKSITSRQLSGTVKRLSDSTSGKYSEMASGGSLYGEMFDLNGFEIATGYNGKSGWTRDSRNGLRTITGDASKDFQAEAVYRNTRWLNTKNEKAKISAGGTTNVDGKTANCVLITNAKGVQIKSCFDSVSGLPVYEEIPQGELTKTFYYSDYRAVNGIQTAFSIRSKVGDETYEIKLDSAQYNQPIAKSNFDFPKISNEPLPDIPTLLQEIRANADKIDQILENYSYTELRIDRDLDKNGNLIEKSSEKQLLTFYKGYRISRLIEKNGKPLSQSDQEKEDRDAAKKVEEIEKRISEKERKQITQRDNPSGAGGQPKEEGQRITIADALKGSVLINPRRERFKEREVIVFDFEPNPEFKPQTRMEKLFAFCTGAVWVDEKTKQVVRLDSVLTKSFGNFIGKAKQGASFSLENELVNNEIWLPQQADVNLSIKILFAGFNINNLIKYSDYKRFDTEVKDGKVDEIKKP
ncbi:MAG: hypothetical protein K1X72_16505 [Pyrinomonadaceae bacterium]|nr:hypothetical protein [Pyrinomonadaceae bacterium]